MSLGRDRAHLTGRNWSCELMSKPWWVDVLTVIVVLVWMSLTYATMQQQGSTPALVFSSLAFGVVGILVIYGQRLTYLRIGDRIALGFDSPGADRDRRPDEPDRDPPGENR